MHFPYPLPPSIQVRFEAQSASNHHVLFKRLFRLLTSSQAGSVCALSSI